jgi:hypothetical protein
LNSLFRTNIDWGIYLILAVIIRIGFFDMSWLSYVAILITLHQFFLLFYSIGYVIPVRYLAGSLMCVQMLLGPTFAYNGLDQYQRIEYTMRVPEFTYLSYAIPAVACFILGLHATAGNLKGEFVDIKKIRNYVQDHYQLAYTFIAIGFLSSMVSSFFASELAFVFVLLGSFKYIGAFFLILGSRKIKPLYLILVYGSIILSSLRGAMFHDLLIWLMFLGSVFAIKYRPSVPIKAAVVTGFLLMALVIQQLKGDYRKATWQGGQKGGLETFAESYDDSQEQGRFSGKSIAKSNVRINQGFIVTNIMTNVPEKVPYENGDEMLEIVKAAVLPRILAPNKLRAGDQHIFMKYSGMVLQPGTSMALSSLGDAYLNFGTFGGAIFMFFYGLLFSEVLKLFYKNSFEYPVLILFTPLVFYYPIRPDCELQTILGHLFKSCFLIFVIIQVLKVKFRIDKLHISSKTA